MFLWDSGVFQTRFFWVWGCLCRVWGHFLAKEIFMALLWVILKPCRASRAAPACTSVSNSTKAMSWRPGTRRTSLNPGNLERGTGSETAPETWEWHPRNSRMVPQKLRNVPQNSETFPPKSQECCPKNSGMVSKNPGMVPPKILQMFPKNSGTFFKKSIDVAPKNPRMVPPKAGNGPQKT